MSWFECTFEYLSQSKERKKIESTQMYTENKFTKS